MKIKLTELEPKWLKIIDENTIDMAIKTLAEAQGIIFLCPKCYNKNKDKIGVHSIICWFRHRGVPDNYKPLPGRWTPEGTSFDDLTFIHGDPPMAKSILYQILMDVYGTVSLRMDTLQMPKVKITYETLDFDLNKFKQKLQETLIGEMKNAAKEFANAALPRIPVRTGFVAGSIGSLSQLLGSESRFNPIIAFVSSITKRFKSQPRFVTGEYYYPPGGGKVLKTPTSGQQFATQSNNIFIINNDVFTFQFEVDISYFSLQDQFSGRSPTAPWKAFETGQEAFISYMENTGLKRLPKVTDFLNKKKHG